MVMMWSAPETDSMFATNLAEMGARLCRGQMRRSHIISRQLTDSLKYATYFPTTYKTSSKHPYKCAQITSQIMAFNLQPTLSFLSCRAYGKHGMTAVTRQADAILQAFIMIRSSIRLSLISPQPLWTM